jgi:hypothetical protein
MVAFSGADPIGVLIGAKRPSGTLVHKIAVHPDHRRQGHARHLLASLGSKLAILGPPRMIAEVPETLAPANELFAACGYVQEAVLTDYVLERPALTGRQAQGQAEAGPATSERGSSARVEGFVIPVTVDDLAANSLLEEADPHVCWERSVETMTARKDDIAGLAVASEDRIDAYVLYMKADADQHRLAEIVSLRSFVEDGGARLTQLLSRLGAGPVRFPKVHPGEMSTEYLKPLGFHAAGGYRLYAARARSA